MNQFRLFALGSSFDVDQFVSNLALPIDGVWHVGERKPGGVGKYPTSGCKIDLGDGLRIPLSEQERIAQEFLRTHVAGLRDLRAFPGVTHVTLGLQYPVNVRPELAGLCVGPRLGLMRAAVDAGVGVNYYIDLVHDDSAGDESGED